MKYLLLYPLILMSVFHTYCGQSQTSTPQDSIKSRNSPYTESQLKEAAASNVPMSMIRKIRKASNGDILIASWLGVFRYDGKSFTNITSTIPSPNFWDVLEDRKGNLWFATRDSGVYYYNGKSFQHFTTKDGLASNTTLHIYEDRADNIWFGATRYDGKSFRILTTKDGFPSNSIRLILEDKTGKLWFGSQLEDMFVYDGKTFTVLKDKDGNAFNNVWSVIEDKKGNIWFADLVGLWRYDGSTFTMVSQRGAYAIIEDKEGNIWTAGSNSPGSPFWGLSRYDHKSLYNEKPTVTEIVSRPTGLIMGLLEANDGSIWFGGLGYYCFVSRYDGKIITEFKSAAGQK